jgi:CheY-like chemotaxis protein
VDNANSAFEFQIIIVDDDQLVRDFAVHTIEYGINRKVVTFDNGFNAWQFLKKKAQDADIIIADANIPDMDGLELLNQTKKHYPEKKFVLTTSNPDLENTAYQLGADAFLSKPYDVNDLFKVVQQFFDPTVTVDDADDRKTTKLKSSSSKKTSDK